MLPAADLTAILANLSTLHLEPNTAAQVLAAVLAPLLQSAEPGKEKRAAGRPTETAENRAVEAAGRLAAEAEIPSARPFRGPQPGARCAPSQPRRHADRDRQARHGQPLDRRHRPQATCQGGP